MENELRQFLSQYKNSNVMLLELEQIASQMEYESFAELILKLEQQRLLQRVKASGENRKQPSLAYRYKINKAALRQDVQAMIIQMKKRYHSAIYLEYYLTKTVEQWKQDEQYLQQLQQYIEKNGFPTERALVQERSFEIFHDEKFITEQGGKQLLERVKVWDELKIWPIADPVSLAINPDSLSRDVHYYLIVENKATYYGLLPFLQHSQFTALLYGQGKAIISTIEVFPQQLPLKNTNAVYFYFGDLDATGIEIWYALSKKIHVIPALAFYQACLKQAAVKGKEYQRKNAEAMEAFLSYFSEENVLIIKKLFEQGSYYPQEVLKAAQLQQIWRETNWTTLI